MRHVHRFGQEAEKSDNFNTPNKYMRLVTYHETQIQKRQPTTIEDRSSIHQADRQHFSSLLCVCFGVFHVGARFVVTGHVLSFLLCWLSLCTCLAFPHQCIEGIASWMSRLWLHRLCSPIILDFSGLPRILCLLFSYVRCVFAISPSLVLSVLHLGRLFFVFVVRVRFETRRV